MSHEIELLTEIRDLLKVAAEPAIAKRDEKHRKALRIVAGKSQKSRNAILIMDGSRTPTTIAKEVEIDPGQLSRLIKSLAKESLIGTDEKHPKLAISIPGSFFEGRGESE